MTRHALHTLTALALAALVAPSPREAEACSAPAPLPTRSVFPASGATNVPTNARVVVRYALTIGAYEPEVAYRELGDVQIRPAGQAGQPVMTSAALRPVFTTYYERGTTVVVSPKTPLAPNTTYEVLDRFAIPCAGHVSTPQDCLTPEHQVFATFTTGGGPDQTTPSFDGDIRVSFGELRTDTSSCGSGTGGAVRIEWKPAIDDGPLVYTLYRDGSATAPLAYFEGTVVNGRFLCDGDPSKLGVVEIPWGSYSIGAIDLAGNQYRRDFNVRPPYEKCPAAPPSSAPSTSDGGTTAPDANPGTTTDTGVAGESPLQVPPGGGAPGGGGCQMATAPNHGELGGAWAAFVLAAMALVWRRRARSYCSPSGQGMGLGPKAKSSTHISMGMGVA